MFVFCGWVFGVCIIQKLECIIQRLRCIIQGESGISCMNVWEFIQGGWFIQNESVCVCIIQGVCVLCGRMWVVVSQYLGWGV